MQGFKEGYDFFQKMSGSGIGALESEQYIDKINDEIDSLVKSLNEFNGMNTNSAQLQGNIAEHWHAGTFNINAAVRGNDNIANVEGSTKFASVDINTNFGEKYGIKYYRNGVESAKAQAKSVFEKHKEYEANGGIDTIDKYLKDRGYSDESVLNDPIYSGQVRLVPKDQLNEAIEYLKRKIAKESHSRPEQVQRYKETLDHITDRIRESDGTESIPLSRDDAQALADSAKKGKINSEELDLKTEQLVKFENILKQAFKAGMNATIISTVLKMAPEIINAIKYLIDNGEIDCEQFEKIGIAAITGASEGFVRGTISAGITSACKAGLLGQTAKSISPSVIAMTVVLAMDTMKNAYAVAMGKMTRKELTDEIVKEVFISSTSCACGFIGQVLLLEIPILGFMIGSFVGSVIGGIAYTCGYKFMISFCIENGFTMFGIVQQDYVLPKEILEQIGIDLFNPEYYDKDLFEAEKYEFERFETEKFEFERIKPYFLRRGVIGIRKIGYV